MTHSWATVARAGSPARWIALRLRVLHTRTPLPAACPMDRQAAEMDCIALASFTHTHAAPGLLFCERRVRRNGLHCACEFYTHTRTPPHNASAADFEPVCSKGYGEWNGLHCACEFYTPAHDLVPGHAN